MTDAGDGAYVYDEATGEWLSLKRLLKKPPRPVKCAMPWAMCWPMAIASP